MRVGEIGIAGQQPGEQLLVKAAPVNTNAHRLFMSAGDFDHVAELLIPFSAVTHVTGIDSILCQGAGTGAVAAEQFMAVEMEITHQRDVAIERSKLVDDVRYRCGGLVVIDGDAHQFRAAVVEAFDLLDGGGNIGGIGVGHGLHHHRRTTTEPDTGYVHAVPALTHVYPCAKKTRP